MNVHSNIEAYLIHKLGDIGRKVHSLRSRNDQVLLDLKLYMKAQILRIGSLVLELVDIIVSKSNEHKNCIFPGYSHHRQAMPYTLESYFMSFAFSLLQDLEVLVSAYDILNKNPLGVGPGFGLPISVNRELTTTLLGFQSIEVNSLKTINSRGKNELLCLSALIQVSATLNKLSTDFILYPMPEFGYFDIPEEFCTGSSIMPQKKNPDVFELIKARTNRIAAQIPVIYNIMGNLPSGYHRDHQECKKVLMDSFETMEAILMILIQMLSKIQPNPKTIETQTSPDIFATHSALRLIKQGVSYKEAYKKIAEKMSKNEALNPLPVVTEPISFDNSIDTISQSLITRREQFEQSITQLISSAQKIVSS